MAEDNANETGPGGVTKEMAKAVSGIFVPQVILIDTLTMAHSLDSGF